MTRAPVDPLMRPRPAVLRRPPATRDAASRLSPGELVRQRAAILYLPELNPPHEEALAQHGHKDHRDYLEHHARHHDGPLGPVRSDGGSSAWRLDARSLRTISSPLVFRTHVKGR